MLSFIAGIIIFSLLFIAKRTLAFLLMEKKQVALSTIVIVLSESLMILSLYLSIVKYRLNVAGIVIGFCGSLFLMIMFYIFKNLAKNSRDKEDGNF